MITSLLLTTALLQQPELGPVLSPGTSQHFQQGVQLVCEKLSAGEFEEAKNLLARLPKSEVTYRIVWEGVPADRRPSFQTAIEAALKPIEDRTLSVKFKEVTKGEDIRLTFAEELPVSDDSQLPQGLVTFQSFSPQEPAIEGVLALKRMSTKVWSEAGNIINETQFVVASYFGLARNPGLGGISSRTDSLAAATPVVNPRESFLINENLRVVETLRKAVETKTKLQPAIATASIDITELDTGEVAQGDIKEFQFGVYNRGNAPLKFSITPDCSCFRISTTGEVAPGSSSNVNILMDTSAFAGPQLKHLYIHTTDPENPLYIVPVKSMIRPAYRFIEDGPANSILYLDETGGKAVVYLTVDESHDIKPHNITLNGVTGSAVFEPWEGELPDPVLNEGPKQRKGYKITALISPSNVEGRVGATLTVTTNNEDFKVLNHNFYVQRGIAASPKVIYLGEVPNQPMRATAVLSAPGRPFKITKVESRHPNLVTEVEELPRGDYRIAVQYDGKGMAGQLSTSVLVHTDSKDTPVIEIPVQGFIR